MMLYRSKITDDVFVVQECVNEQYIDDEERKYYTSGEDVVLKKIEVNELEKEYEKCYQLILSKIEDDKKRLEPYKGRMNRDVYSLRSELTRIYTYIDNIPIVKLDNVCRDLDSLYNVGSSIMSAKLDNDVIYGSSIFLDVDGWCEYDDLNINGACYSINCIKEKDELDYNRIKTLAIELAVYNKIGHIFNSKWPNDIYHLYQMLLSGKINMDEFVKKIHPVKK